MRLPSLVLAALLGASTAFAQSINQTYVTGLINTLKVLGLTDFITAASTVYSTPQGRELFSQISATTPYTVFAPNNNVRNTASCTAPPSLIFYFRPGLA